MRPGQAIAQTCVGVPDFPGDKHAVTMSPGGPGKLIDCMKCVDCGWSRTMGHSPTKPDADEAYRKNMALRKMLDEMPIAQPVQPAKPCCGIKAGESIEQAAEGWAQWCEVRGNQMLANFLRKVAQPVPSTKAAL